MIQQDEADNEAEVSHHIHYSSLPTSQYLWLLCWWQFSFQMCMLRL